MLRTRYNFSRTMEDRTSTSSNLDINTVNRHILSYTPHLDERYPDDQFFSQTAVINAFKTYVNYVVSRYASNPTVFGWELMNEPRCGGSGGLPVRRISLSFKHLYLCRDVRLQAPVLPLYSQAGSIRCQLISRASIRTMLWGSEMKDSSVIQILLITS
jgi:hypothetical protein